MLLTLLAAGWLLLSGGDIREAPREVKLRLVEQINADRRAAGLQPVEFSAELSQAADAHCREMLAEGYTSHWNRAGWKPYLRYTQAGVHDATSENIHAAWASGGEPGSLWERVLDGHRRFMAERPPFDGHRKSILTPQHTHVGIGVAYNDDGLRLIEVFGAKHAELEPAPLRASLGDWVEISGKLLREGDQLLGVSVYYEPLPRSMTRAELQATSSYGLPREEQIERPRLQVGRYVDGTVGTVTTSGLRFTAPLRFWKSKPGVYTVAVWIEPQQGPAFIGAMTAIVVEE
jgi:hypothetical protein